VLDSGDQAPVGGAVAAQFVGDQHPGHLLQPGEQLAEEPGRSLRVAPGGDQNVQDIAVLVDRAPQVVGLTCDLDEDLVEMPLVPGTRPAPA
jgi:hypothetical protein